MVWFQYHTFSFSGKGVGVEYHGMTIDPRIERLIRYFVVGKDMKAVMFYTEKNMIRNGGPIPPISNIALFLNKRIIRIIGHKPDRWHRYLYDIDLVYYSKSRTSTLVSTATDESFISPDNVKKWSKKPYNLRAHDLQTLVEYVSIEDYYKTRFEKDIFHLISKKDFTEKEVQFDPFERTVL